MYTQMLQVHASVWPSETSASHNQYNQQLEDSRKVYTLPDDPRSWSRDQVLAWLRNMQKQHGLPTIEPDRFHMNGKALCLMNVDMFVQRVPLGGKLLYKDFQIRLTQALYSSVNTLPQEQAQ